MILKEKLRLASYMTKLLSEGRVVFSVEEALKALGIGRGAFLDAAERQQRRNRLLKLRRGFYVIVPPEYLILGAPPAHWYIDSLMQYEGCPYYMGLLQAAQFYGVSHQAVMEIQVVTDKHLPKIIAGRSRMNFYYRKDMSCVSRGVEEITTPTGFMKISSAELTVLDLLHYRRGSGGFHNIATVLSELGEKIDPDKLVELSSAFERSVVQRLGYLLDWLGFNSTAGPLNASISGNPTLPWVELEAWRGRLDPDLISEPVERNRRWNVIVREPPDPD